MWKDRRQIRTSQRVEEEEEEVVVVGLFLQQAIGVLLGGLVAYRFCNFCSYHGELGAP